MLFLVACDRWKAHAEEYYIIIIEDDRLSCNHSKKGLHENIFPWSTNKRASLSRSLTSGSHVKTLFVFYSCGQIKQKTKWRGRYPARHCIIWRKRKEPPALIIVLVCALCARFLSFPPAARLKRLKQTFPLNRKHKILLILQTAPLCLTTIMMIQSANENFFRQSIW